MFDPNTSVFHESFSFSQTDWSYEAYSSDSSDLCYHSDSSEGLGNKWRNYGYQLYKSQNKNKKSNRDNVNFKFSGKNHTFSTVQDYEKRCFSCNSADDHKNRSTVEHKNRSTVKEKGKPNAKVKFSDEWSDDFPSKNDKHEPVKKKAMLSKDDIYNLLSKSRAQENKVAELWQAKVGQQYSEYQPQSASRYGNAHSPTRQSYNIGRNVFGSKSV